MRVITYSRLNLQETMLTKGVLDLFAIWDYQTAGITFQVIWRYVCPLPFGLEGRLCDIGTGLIYSWLRRSHGNSERQWSLLKYREKKNISICRCDPSKMPFDPHKQLWLVASACFSIYQMSESLRLTDFKIPG